MKNFQWIILIFAGMAIALHGCDSDPFPVGEAFNEGLQVPFVTTHTFNFKTGSGAISGEQANLEIISGADVNNLITAAPGISEQSAEKGVISGVVVDASGEPLTGVSIGTTDANGNIIRNADGTITAGVADASGNIVAPLLYNSINGIPEFINTGGTANSGSFTALNVPPGQHFIKAVQGGRGNGRLNVFVNGLSFFDIEVFPVALPTATVTGVVNELDNPTPVPQAKITFPGLGGELISNENGNFSASGLGSDSRFLVQLRSAGHRDTYQQLRTDRSLIQVGVVTPEITKNLISVSDSVFQAMVQSAGITAASNTGTILGKVVEFGGKKNNAIVTATKADGTPDGDIFYFPAGSDLPVCNLSGGAGCLTMTTSEGRFLILNLSPGDIFLKVQAEVSKTGGVGGTTKSSGDLATQVFSGGVSLVNVGVAPIDRTDTGSTLTLSGVVRDENAMAVGSASISVLGVSDPLSKVTSDSVTGKYIIQKAIDLNTLSPLLANTTPIFRLEEGVHTTTYQTLDIGRQDLSIDLTLLSSSLIVPAVGTGAILGRVVNRRSGGRVDEVEILATQMVDEGTHQTVVTGQPVGNINYFNGSVTATSTSGLFLIQNLRPGLVMLKVNSSDDSGNQIVRVFNGGVTITNMLLNHVPISVPVKGTTTNLRNSQVTQSINFKILGEQRSFTSDNTGKWNASIPTNGSFIVHAKNSASIDTFNDQLSTGINEKKDVKLFLSSQLEIDTLAAQGGVVPDFGKGFIAGEVRKRQIGKASFSPIGTAETPQAIATGDFDRDTLIDFAVVASVIGNPGQVEIFLGQADGSFKAQTPPVVVGTDPRSIRAGDFNGDGLLDLVVANHGPGLGSLSVLIGGGDGTFLKGSTDITEDIDLPVFILLTDLNQNGEINLVIANEGSDTVSLPVGAGSGATPLCPNPCTVKADPRSIASGDFDGDGKGDLAVASDGSNIITLILSSGNIPSTSVQAGNQPSSIDSGDLNRDTFIDLVVANSGSDSISTFLGDGNGGFSKVDCISETLVLDDCDLGAGSTPRSITLNDFDRDGRIDLAVVNEGSGKVVILSGKGDGTFTPATNEQTFTVGAGPKSLAVDDLNQDGREDIIIANFTDKSISVLLSDETKPAQSVRIEARDPDGIVVGTVRYLAGDPLDPLAPLFVKPSLTQSSSTGRFIIFNLPVGLTMLNGTSKGVSPPMIGNSLVNITQVGSLFYTHLAVDTGSPGTIITQGLTCRPVGIVCSRVGNAGISFLGTTKAICKSDPDCISKRLDGNYTVALDPHSNYVVKIVGPNVALPGDTDGDGIFDLGDNCPNISNPDQADSNGNRIGDACELQVADDDLDGIPNENDNCPFTPNPGQRDDDQDGIGNDCDGSP